MFTCTECENSYTPDIDGDAEERICYSCMEEEYNDNNNR